MRSSNARAEAVLAKMLAAGMLTTDPAIGKEATPLEMDRAEAALVEDDLETQPEVTFTHVVRFLRASAAAALEMKLRPIERVIATVRSRKSRRRAELAARGPRCRAPRGGAFIRLRPLLFGAQDACLFDSLALVRFLSYYRIFPTCVIGVQTGPFGAHCWVQEGDVVFNDAPEYVRRVHADPGRLIEDGARVPLRCIRLERWRMAPRARARGLLSERLRSGSRAWQCVLERPGLQVFCSDIRPGSSEPYRLTRGAGVVLGKLFVAGGEDGASVSAPLSLGEDESEKILQSAGRRLIDRYWGRYVAFLHDAASGTDVGAARSHRRSLPCFTARLLGVGGLLLPYGRGR